MIFLELDPDVVKPGWTPLIITALLGIALVFLFRSMRKQFRKINIPRQEADEQPVPPEEKLPEDPSAGSRAD
jgi:hypothetical protein